MRSVNPLVIPRNHIVEKVLEAANGGNLKPLQDFLSVLREPYSSRDCIKKYQTPSKSSDSVYKTFCGT